MNIYFILVKNVVFFSTFSIYHEILEFNISIYFLNENLDFLKEI